MTSPEKTQTNLITVDEKLECLAQELGVDLSVSIESRMNAAVEKTNQALKLVVEAGICYISVKEELPHGEFQGWLENHGIAPQRAREAMQFAHVTKSMPDKQRHQLFSMAKSKAMLLAKADKEVIEQLIDDTESEDLASLNTLSFKEMRDRIRELETKNTNLTLDNETKESTIRTMNDRAAGARNFNKDYPDFVNLIRDEGNALTTEVTLRLDELERHANELISMPSSTDKAMHSIAATSLSIHLKALAARAAQISRHLSLNLGDAITELKSEHILNEDEIEQAIRDRQTMTQELVQQQKIRDDARENAKPKKPGRPKLNK